MEGVPEMSDFDDDLFAVRPAEEKPAAQPEPKPPVQAPPTPAPKRLPWKRNPGHLPEEAKGKRVVVMLENGRVHGDTPVNTDSKLGWDAETTRWSKPQNEYDVRLYYVL